MPGGVEHRSVSPLIEAIRIVLRGKKHHNSLRFADELASRNQPPPDVPGGPYHKTTKIYYFARDARREVEQPFLITSSAKQIESGVEDTCKPKALTPGQVYKED